MRKPKHDAFWSQTAFVAICFCFSILFSNHTASAQAPSIVDIIFEDPLLETTSSSTLKWSITFSEPVLTPSPSDFQISETASGATITNIAAVAGSGSQSYIVAASGHASSYSGSITLEVANSNTISNLNNVPLSSTIPTGDTENTYLIQAPGPKLLSVQRQSPTTLRTAADTLVFRLSFDQAIANMDATDFKLINEGTGADVSGVNATVSQVGLSNLYDLSFSGSGVSNLNTEVSLIPSQMLDVKNLSQTSNLEIGANLSPLETSFILDNTAPTVSLSSTASSPITTAIPVTFLVSEAGTDFNASDVEVSNGTLSGFSSSGTTFSAFVTPTPNSNATLSLTVNANAFIDAAGLGNTASTPLSFSIGSIRPTPTLSLAVANAVQTDVFLVNIDTQVETTNFDNDDLSISGGLVTGFNGNGQNYTAEITPTANSAGTINLSIAENAYIDSYQNSNLASNSFSVAYDTKAPTVSISGPGTTQVGPFPISLSLSEIATGFDLSDLSVTNGSINNLVANGLDYTATITPNAGTTGTLTLSVTANSFSDIAGNLNPGTSQYSVAINTTSPTVSISATANGPVNQTTPINFVLSGPSDDFTVSDVNVSGGSLSDLTLAQNTYTALFTPNPNSTEPAIISVPANAFSIVGSTATNTASQPLTLEVDTVSPAVIISGPSAPQSGAFTVSFVFSEPPIGFTTNSVTVENGSLSNLTGSGTTRTATVTPANSAGIVTLSILSGRFQDQNGNHNLSSNPFAVDFDTQAPRLQSIKRLSPLTETTSATAVTFRVQFSEVVTALSASDFQVNGPTGTSLSLSSTSSNFVDVNISGGNLATYTGSIGLGLIANPSFTDATGNRLTDTNATDNVETFERVNDTTAPSIKISAAAASCTTPFSATFIFSEAITGFTLSDIQSSNASLSYLNNLGSSTYSVLVTPIALPSANGFQLRLDVPANAVSDSAGNPSDAAEAFELTCQNSLKIQSETRRFIAEQLQARSELLTTHSPKLTSRFRDLRRRRKALGTDRSDFLQSDQIPDPADLRVKAEFTQTSQNDHALMHLETSSSRITNFVSGANGSGTQNSKSDLWVKARWAMNKTAERDTKSGLVYVGVDYQLSPRTMLGFLGQYDWSDANDRVENYAVTAKGWMLGPYLVTELKDDFYFDARVAWGTAKNNIQPDKTFEDEFDSKRWLVSANLSGRIKGSGALKAYSLKPELSFKHFNETQDAYTDSNTVSIPKTRAGITRLSFGPSLQRDVVTSSTSRLTIETGLKGVFTSATSGTIDALNRFSETRTNSLSARLETGLGWDWDLGYGIRSLELDGFIDGIGKKNSQTYGFGLKFRQPF